MSLRDQIAADVVLAFSSDYLGEVILYKGTEIQAIFTPLVDPQTGRGGSASTATLQVQVSDVPTWSVNDQVEQQSQPGEIWKVKREGPGSTWYKFVLELERDRRMR